MTSKELSRSTNPPHLGDYHRVRLYPRYWDMSSIVNHNAGSSRRLEQPARVEEQVEDELLCPKAFEEWQIGRHYPGDKSDRCETFVAF
ncbi:MAG: hypothetical protein RML93_08995 [Anaerolineales bacterium]|nr:hypothetical protein [Anaerolineales bacterium]MCS7248287.1 hypothetical protein [Anaerolineales bacterium]MDW8162101.1 hypothetical protein [Anaerolineales bacterium]MDW8447410.1 hypothetical protein [Anaerolineales bacterium]